MAPDDRPPFNVALFAFSQVIVIIATIPAFLPKFAKVLAVLLVGWVFCHIISTQTTGNKSGDQEVGTVLLVQYFAVIDYVLLTRPDDPRNIKDKDATKMAERSFKSRVVWAMKLYTDPRGIGCIREGPDIQNRPSPSTPRWKFVLYRTTYTLISILAISVAWVVNAFNPALTTPGKVLTDAPFHLRALGVAGFAMAGVGLISAVHSSLAVITVGCGFSSPERWPYLFGTPLHAWSIKRFWRRVWHQLLRKVGPMSSRALKISLTSIFYIGRIDNYNCLHGGPTASRYRNRSRSVQVDTLLHRILHRRRRPHGRRQDAHWEVDLQLVVHVLYVTTSWDCLRVPCFSPLGVLAGHSAIFK